MERTAYDILGVSTTAPPEVMKAAKVALAKIYHPDNGSAPDAEAMAQVNEAYDTLTDPERRSIHDSFHAGGGSDDAQTGDAGAGWGDDPVAPESGNEGWGDEPSQADAASAPAAEASSPPPYQPSPAVPAVVAPSQAMEPHHQGWYSAVQLAQAVQSGQPLPRQHSTLILGHGEIYHCGVEAEMEAYYARDEVSYNSGAFIAGRSLTGMALTGAASMAYNSHKKNKAQRQAAAQWRREGVVPLHITNQRLLVAQQGQLNSYWYEGGIAAFEPQFGRYSMMLQTHGGAPLNFVGPAVPYVAVMLHVLLHGHVPNMQ